MCHKIAVGETCDFFIFMVLDSFMSVLYILLGGGELYLGRNIHKDHFRHKKIDLFCVFQIATSIFF